MLDTRYNVSGLKDLANTNMVYTKHSRFLCQILNSYFSYRWVSNSSITKSLNFQRTEFLLFPFSVIPLLWSILNPFQSVLRFKCRGCIASNTGGGKWIVKTKEIIRHCIYLAMCLNPSKSYVRDRERERWEEKRRVGGRGTVTDTALIIIRPWRAEGCQKRLLLWGFPDSARSSF